MTIPKDKFNSIADLITKGFEVVDGVLIVFTTLLIAFQVLLRAVFSRSIPWADEVSLIAFIYITFISAAVACRFDIHLRVELFVSWLPKKGKHAVEYFNILAHLFVGLMMVYFGAKLTRYGVASIMPSTRSPT